MKLLFTFLIAISATFCAFASTPSNGSSVLDCDTIFTVEGKTYLCQILKQDKEEIQFSLCDDPFEKVFVIPKSRISSLGFGQINGHNEILAKNLGPEIQPKPKVTKPSPKRPPKQKQKRTNEELASDAFWQGILSLVLTASIILIPVGFFVGLFAVAKGKKLLETTKGHSKFKRIRRRARWAIILGSLSMMLSLGFIIWLINALSNMQFPDSDWSSGSEWSWTNG